MIPNGASDTHIDVRMLVFKWLDIRMAQRQCHNVSDVVDILGRFLNNLYVDF